MTTFEKVEQTEVSEVNIHNEIRKFMVKDLEIKPVPCLYASKLISDLGLDSLDRTSLCAHLEEKYNIRLDLGPNEDISVADLAKRVLAEYKSKSAAVKVD